MKFLSQYSTIILIVMLNLLAVTLVIEITAMGSKRLGPAFRNKVMWVRVILQGLVNLVFDLLILAKFKKKGAVNW